MTYRQIIQILRKKPVINNQRVWESIQNEISGTPAQNRAAVGKKRYPKWLIPAVAALTVLAVTIPVACYTIPKYFGATESAACSWPYQMVNWRGIRYVVTDEDVPTVARCLGEVAVYSDHETDENRQSFSNYYPKGTKLYSIPNVKIESAIAVKSNNQYKKLVNVKDIKQNAQN